MILLSVAQVAVSAAVVSLATGCVRNIVQTYNIVKSVTEQDETGVADLLPSHAKASNEALVDHLQGLSREEIINLFCRCQPPENHHETLCGEWDGSLLSNNNLGMTTVGSKFMTHFLFSAGKLWNGKRFGKGQKGINRFIERGEDLRKEMHSFDFALDESRLQQGTKSVRLVYSNYQNPISPWRSMIDEVRHLHGDVLIGVGSMAWSGGMLNGAPFCLVPATTKQKDQ